jgi:hypothetical protein
VIESRKKWLLYALVAMSLLNALDQSAVYWSRGVHGGGAHLIFRLAYPFFLVLWMDADSRGYPQIRWPFDRGYLMLQFWPLLRPVYLYRTRRVRGLAPLMGFVILAFLGWLVEATIDAFQ